MFCFIRFLVSAGQACDKGFQWERALELLDRMVERDGVKPNLFAYNHAMSACVRQVAGTIVVWLQGTILVLLGADWTG